MMSERQVILKCEDNYSSVADYLTEIGCNHLLLVCGPSSKKLRISGFFDELESRTGIKVTAYSGFSPNPNLRKMVEQGSLMPCGSAHFVIPLPKENRISSW